MYCGEKTLFVAMIRATRAVLKASACIGDQSSRTSRVTAQPTAMSTIATVATVATVVMIPAPGPVISKLFDAA